MTKQWVLDFGEDLQFSLREGKPDKWVNYQKRVTEEMVETILIHWGKELLPGAPVHIIGRQSGLMQVADLYGVDAFGQLHLFELKTKSPPTATSKELHQLISYMVNRTTRMDGLHELLAASLWYGRRSMAARLGGLIGWDHVGNESGDNESGGAVGEGARHGERERARVRKAARVAREQSGLQVSEEVLLDLARKEMSVAYGLDHDGPLEGDVADLWSTFQDAHGFGRGWHFEGASIAWLMAPNVGDAVAAARHLVDRGVDVRVVRLEVRETVPGRQWSIEIEFPMGLPWVERDRTAERLRTVVNAHINRFPGNAARMRYSVEGASKGEIRWDGLAGAAAVKFEFSADQVRWDWYSHWWTEGQALPLRNRMNRTKQHLLREFPDVLPGGGEFDTAAARLVDTAWKRLEELGAPELDRWACYRIAPNEL